MRIILSLFLFQILLSNHIAIDLITTNDIHGVIQDQKAYFMNPQYPPNIIGGSGFYNYVSKLKKDNDYIDHVLKEGGKRANDIASKKVLEIKKIIGF